MQDEGGILLPSPSNLDLEVSWRIQDHPSPQECACLKRRCRANVLGPRDSLLHPDLSLGLSCVSGASSGEFCSSASKNLFSKEKSSTLRPVSATLWSQVGASISTLPCRVSCKSNFPLRFLDIFTGCENFFSRYFRFSLCFIVQLFEELQILSKILWLLSELLIRNEIYTPQNNK